MKYFIIFAILQVVFWIIILLNSQTDIQFLPAIMIILNSINFGILYNFIDKKLKK